MDSADASCGVDVLTDEVSDWILPPSPTEIPVTVEEYIYNVRSACKRDLPNIAKVTPHDRIMVMVCGGPSAKDHLEEIRVKNNDDRYDVFCSNKTHDWLISNGVVPHTHFLIDPKKSKIEDVQNPHKDVRYLVGVACCPEVFDALKGFNVHRMFPISNIGKSVGSGVTDIDIIRAFFDRKDYDFVEGGTMAGLRAMTLANVLGYQTVEFYGFDSCYFTTDYKGRPVFYSYDKNRQENIMEAQTTSGKTYLSTPVFASQARQFIKWKHKLAWMNFIIHGDSLTHEINAIDEEKNQLKGRTISDYMLSLNKESHAKNDKFGASMDSDVGISNHAGRMAVLAGQIVRKNGSCSITDYGCGKAVFSKCMPPISGLTVNNYDPCIDEYSTKPPIADIVVCLDVLEHVEHEYLNDVLNELSEFSKELLYVSIATGPAQKCYSDGQNMHLIQEDGDWWIHRLKKYFEMLEVSSAQSHVVGVFKKRTPIEVRV